MVILVSEIAEFWVSVTFNFFKS